MNRPEPIELENNLGPDAVTGEINRVPWMAYDVDEMDLYIAEKDAAIAELKNKLDDAQAKVYADSIDAWKRERRLRRALWMARAMRAEAQWNRQLRDAGIAFAIGENKSWDSWNQKQKKWQVVECKCRAKAEEYK